MEAERLAQTSNTLLNLLENTIPETGDVPHELVFALEALNRYFSWVVAQ